jgi:hypothetical protein
MVRSTVREAGEAAFEALTKPAEPPSGESGPKDDIRSKSSRLKELRMEKAAAASSSKDAPGQADSDGENLEPLELFMFGSAKREGLHAFAGDAAGTKLPRRFGPWKSQGVIATGEAPPHRLSRPEIEKSIRQNGFQLWQVRRPR